MKAEDKILLAASRNVDRKSLLGRRSTVLALTLCSILAALADPQFMLLEELVDSSRESRRAELTVLIPPTMESLPILVAQDGGIFDKYRLRVTITCDTALPNTPDSLKERQFDIATCSLPSLVSSSRHDWLGVVSGLTRTRNANSSSRPMYWMLSRRISGTSNYGDDGGMTVASFCRFIGWSALQNGVRDSNMVGIDSIQECSANATAKLCARSAIDRAIVPEPFGGHVFFDYNNEPLMASDDTAACILVAPSPLLESDRGELDRFRAAVKEAVSSISAGDIDARERQLLMRRYCGVEIELRGDPYSFEFATDIGHDDIKSCLYILSVAGISRDLSSFRMSQLITGRS